MSFSSDDSTKLPAVVIDNGSSFIKAGFARDESPKSVFPSKIGFPRLQNMREFYVGNEAQEKRGILSLRYPISFGVVVNWDNMEKLWHHAFYNELRIAPEEHPVLLTEPPNNPRGNREKMTQIMFETYLVPALNISNPCVLSLYASGRTSGVVVDSGAGMTYFVPVVEGEQGTIVCREALLKSDFGGGGDLTHRLMKLITESGYSFTRADERDIVGKMKDQLCYVAADFEAEMRRPNSEIERRYELPDGEFVTVGKERFLCPEALFKPSLIEQEMPGIHETLDLSLRKYKGEDKDNLRQNILLAGGNTMFPGMKERLEKEMRALQSPHDFRVIDPPERHLSAWKGGSLIASKDDFLDKLCMSKDDYDEHGPSYMHRKCP